MKNQKGVFPVALKTQLPPLLVCTSIKLIRPNGDRELVISFSLGFEEIE